MPIFKKLTLGDIPALREYFSQSRGRGCDNTIGGVFMWRDFFCMEYAIICKTLVFKMKYLGGVTAFTVPLGTNTEEAIAELAQFCLKENMPLIFCTATREDLPVISKKYEYTYTSEKDWADYIYDAEELSTFSGRKFNGQRNHINYFVNTYPDYTVLPVTEENLPEITAFYEWFKEGTDDKGTPVFAEERRKVSEVLENFEAYGQQGCVVYAGGKVVAFAIGERVGDTLYVHIEKADASCRGAYPMIVREFVRMYDSCGVKYVNREDDSGDEGLRKSKLSYHPVDIVEKYTLTITPSLCTVTKKCCARARGCGNAGRGDALGEPF